MFGPRDPERDFPWHREGGTTFQSAIKPRGIRIDTNRNMLQNVVHIQQSRYTIRNSINYRQDYGQRDRQIVIDERKQRRKPHDFASQKLYELTAAVYAGTKIP